MRPYGEKPKNGEYDGWFDPIEKREPPLDDEQAKDSLHSVHPDQSSRMDTVRPNVKIEFGVNEIRVAGGGKKSRTFNDGANGKKDPGVGERGRRCFHFSPTHDGPEMKIRIQVHHQHHIKSARLEMFCRGYEEPIWTRCWGDLWAPTLPGDERREIEEIIPREEKEGTTDLEEINWSEIELPKDLVIPGGAEEPSFADGVPVVPHSPYRLKFTVSARASSADPEEKDRYGFPRAAWTYVHVLVKEIKLAWGKEELIPKDRPDFTFSAVTKAREKDQAFADEIAGLEEELETSDFADDIAGLREKETKARQDNIDYYRRQLESAETEADRSKNAAKIREFEEKPLTDTAELKRQAKENKRKLIDSKKQIRQGAQKNLSDAEESVKNNYGELWERQKSFFKKLADANGSFSPGQGDPKSKIIELNFNVPDFEKHDTETEFTYFRDMWGGGPLIPLVALAKIKKIDGKGVVDPPALGRARFVWEWQDNEKEDLGSHLDKWLTESSGITKHFIKKVFEDNRDTAKFPCHGFNCPAEYGGKRGKTRPAPEDKKAHIFPQSPKDFPNQVKHELKKRDWAAVSYADPSAELKDRQDTEASTAILFQPSIIAGDRFRLSVCLLTEEINEFDKDLESEAYYDLIGEAKEKNVPWATTYYFENWRYINTTLYYTPSFAATYAEIVQYIEDQLAREIGYKMKIETKPFPDLRAYLSGSIEDLIRKRKLFNSNSSAIFLRAVKDVAAGDKDYAFDVLPNPDSVIDQYRNGKWFVVDGLTGGSKGQELLGETSRAKALVQVDHSAGATDKPKLVLMIGDGSLTKGEDYNCGEGEEGSKEKGTIVDLSEPAVTRWSGKGVTVKTVADKKMSSRKVTVSVAGLNPITLKYTAGKVRATRHLSAANIGQLRAFCAGLKDHRLDKKLEITVTGKMNDRGTERVEEVKKWLIDHILDTKQVMYKNFDAAFNDVKPEDLNTTPDKWDQPTFQKIFRDYQRNLNWRKIFNQALKETVLPDYPDWKTEGHAFFYYLRGRTPLDKEFTTGGIENDWSTERFGLAGITQPAVSDQDKREKRWLKSPKIVVAHEFGHLFMLQHSPPRVLDSKEATGKWEEHLPHDACLMNYDPDTLSLCGWCMLRKRGWKVEEAINAGKFTGNEAAWVQKCKQLMEADAAKGPASKVRLAMFLLDMNKYDPGAGDQTEAAIAQMQAARSEVPENRDDQKHIFLLRCEVVFYDKINRPELARQSLDKLKRCTEFPVDVDDLQDDKGEVSIHAQVGSNWKLK